MIRYSENYEYFIAVGLIILCTLSFSWADEKNDARKAMYHLRDGIGARAGGMGNSFVSVANDASASYWNPAELACLDNMNAQFTGMYAIPVPNSPYLFGAVVQRIKNDQGGIGVFWHNFMVGNLDSANREHVFGISYGRSLTPAFRVGMNVKYYYQMVNKSKFESFGFDMSATIQPTGTLLKFSGNITDIGSLVTDPTGIAGISYPFIYNLLLLSVDVSRSIGQKYKPHMGIEITPFREIYIIDSISFRLGFDDFNYSVGLGIKLNKYNFDYSYINNQGTPSYTHRISITAFF